MTTADLAPWRAVDDLPATCGYTDGAARCVFGAGHAVAYHHLDDGRNVGPDAPPSTATVTSDFLDSTVPEQQGLPGWEVLDGIPRDSLASLANQSQAAHEAAHETGYLPDDGTATPDDVDRAEALWSDGYTVGWEAALRTRGPEHALVPVTSRWRHVTRGASVLDSQLRTWHVLSVTDLPNGTRRVQMVCGLLDRQPPPHDVDLDEQVRMLVSMSEDEAIRRVADTLGGKLIGRAEVAGMSG